MALLHEKTAIVTGAASGVGLAVARRLHAEGAAVVLCDIREEKLRNAAGQVAEKGERVHAVPADVRDDQDIGRVVREAKERFGQIDILVSCAGVLKFGRLEEATPEDWDAVMRTNAYGTWRFMAAVVPEMRRAGGGAIVNISSINGIKAFLGAGLYSASKAALQMLSQVMAMETADDNIRVNCVLPGLIEGTDFIAPVVGEENVPEFYESLRELHPLGRNATPEDVADAALFLASDQSRFITGTLLNVDGGRHLATNRPPAA